MIQNISGKMRFFFLRKRQKRNREGLRLNLKIPSTSNNFLLFQLRFDQTTTFQPGNSGLLGIDAHQAPCVLCFLTKLRNLRRCREQVTRRCELNL